MTGEDRLEVWDLLKNHSTTKVIEITKKQFSIISTIKGESVKILSRMSQVNYGNLLQVKLYKRLKHQDLDFKLFGRFSEKRGEKGFINGPILIDQIKKTFYKSQNNYRRDLT